MFLGLLTEYGELLIVIFMRLGGTYTMYDISEEDDAVRVIDGILREGLVAKKHRYCGWPVSGAFEL